MNSFSSANINHGFTLKFTENNKLCSAQNPNVQLSHYVELMNMVHCNQLEITSS